MHKKSITINDTFWNAYRNRVKDVMIPYQWRVLNDEIEIASDGASTYNAREKSHALRNFRIAAGLETGEFHGMWFQDSDVYKWLEAAAYVLKMQPNAELQAHVEDTVVLISKAQQPDGYLDTYFQLKEPKRKLQHIAQSHELYCMGHYIEAAIAINSVLHNQLALDIAIKMADFIDRHFGPGPDKLHGYPGHPEIELALAKLAEATGEVRYLKLAAYMINTRGTKPNFFAEQAAQHGTFTEQYWGGQEPAPAYFQADVPVREIKAAEGHAVRMVYLLTGMAQVARQLNDSTLFAACQRLFKNIVNKQMYVTGGVGATANGEAFTFDYDLPNDTAYAETCASCAMVFFTNQMQQIHPNRAYTDVLEQELFNGTIAGMALDGEHFFYVNPLEVDPKASAMDPNKQHILPTRPAWLACACCPPNLARLIGELDRYIYTIKDDTVYLDQYIGSELVLDNGVVITQTGNYPWSGDVQITVATEHPIKMTLAIRQPAWAEEFTVQAGDGAAMTTAIQSGYVRISRTFKGVTRFTVHIPLKPRRVYANPAVKADIGKVAIARGPIVYCLEAIDNGSQLPWRTLAPTSDLVDQIDHRRFDIPVVTITASGGRLPGKLNQAKTATALNFVPYFTWANRQVGEMTVFVREQ